jgi:hypothetical protein
MTAIIPPTRFHFALETPVSRQGSPRFLSSEGRTSTFRLSRFHSFCHFPMIFLFSSSFIALVVQAPFPAPSWRPDRHARISTGIVVASTRTASVPTVLYALAIGHPDGDLPLGAP